MNGNGLLFHMTQYSQFLPCVVKLHCSFKCPLLLCTWTLQWWFFYLFTLANRQNTWNVGGAANDKITCTTDK